METNMETKATQERKTQYNDTQHRVRHALPRPPRQEAGARNKHGHGNGVLRRQQIHAQATAQQRGPATNRAERLGGPDRENTNHTGPNSSPDNVHESGPPSRQMRSTAHIVGPRSTAPHLQERRLGLRPRLHHDGKHQGGSAHRSPNNPHHRKRKEERAEEENAADAEPAQGERQGDKGRGQPANTTAPGHRSSG